MVDERTQALIHAVVDGEADAEAAVQLERLLDTDPEARDLMVEFQALSDMLEQMPLLEPPMHLTRALRGDPPEPPTGPLIQLLTAVAGAKALRYAYAFSAGILVTVVALQLGGPQMPDGEGMVGTMAPVATGDSLVLGSTEMRIRTDYVDGLVQVDLQVDAPRTTELEAVFGVEQVRVVSFSSEQGPTPTLDLQPGRLTATVAGSQHYTLVLEPVGEAPSMIMTLRSPDGAATQQVMQLTEDR
jgi:hypothetical protein